MNNILKKIYNISNYEILIVLIIYERKLHSIILLIKNQCIMKFIIL